MKYKKEIADNLGHTEVEKPTSWITIIPFLWFVLQNSKGAIFWKGSVDSSALSQVQFEGSSFDRLILTILLIIGFYIYYSRRHKIALLIKNNIWLFGLFGYMLLSICWTEFPFIAFKRWVRTFGTLMVIGLLVTENEPLNAAIKVLKLACSFMLPVSLLLIFVFPGIGTALSPEDGIIYWTGITTHKNMLGQWSTLGVLLYLWLLLIPEATTKDRIINISMFVLSWVLLIGSKSTTSLTLTLVGIGIFIAFAVIKKVGKFGFITIPITGITLVSCALLIEQFFFNKPIVSSLLNIAGKDSTLTGRTSLWEYVISVGAEKMWLGHGYATFWISKWGDRARSILGWDMYSAHNGFLDIFIQMGIVGVILLLGYLVFAVRGVYSVYRHDFRYGILWVTFLTITLFSNLSESNFGVMANEFWFLSVLVSFHIPKAFLVKGKIQNV